MKFFLIIIKSVVVRNKKAVKNTTSLMNNLCDFQSRTMEWTEIHDALLCRDVLLEESYKYKKGSNEKGKKWTEIAKDLNKSEEVKFKVTQRGVRERMERLQKKHMEK